MSGARRIEDALTGANTPGLVAYLTAGFPSRAAFPAHLRAVAGAADVVEIGVPFSDPMADGRTIQRASEVALAGGTSLAWLFEVLRRLRPLPAPIVLMSYLNPLLAHGTQHLVDDALEAGVAGFVVPDLPLEEAGSLDAALARRGLALIQLVTPLSAPTRLATLCARSRGFVYAVTDAGCTGGQAPSAHELAPYLARVRAASALPVCAGFGIRESAQVAGLAPHVDGVVVGSALVEALEAGQDPVALLRGLRGEEAA